MLILGFFSPDNVNKARNMNNTPWIFGSDALSLQRESTRRVNQHSRPQFQPQLQPQFQPFVEPFDFDSESDVDVALTLANLSNPRHNLNHKSTRRINQHSRLREPRFQPQPQPLVESFDWDSESKVDELALTRMPFHHRTTLESEAKKLMALRDSDLVLPTHILTHRFVTRNRGMYIPELRKSAEFKVVNRFGVSYWTKDVPDDLLADYRPVLLFRGYDV